MLYAILYNGNDEMIAAAPACLQQPEGNGYWAEVYQQAVQLTDDCQTAYVEVVDPQLIADLDSLETSDDLLSHCRQQIEAISMSSNGQHVHPKAA